MYVTASILSVETRPQSIIIQNSVPNTATAKTMPIMPNERKVARIKIIQPTSKRMPANALTGFMSGKGIMAQS